tara:strand:+ start:2358 stop:3962 length:1605 start_codon:yes stop_codon:yes gene_type:complete
MIFVITTIAAAVDKPNIVFILADDLGIGDVGCYGGDRCMIDTPNLDALAAGGLRFTDAHSSASVCAPTRRALMTGRYPWRFSDIRGGGPWGFVGPKLGTEKATLGKLLRGSGYRTGYVGKWHLGTTMQTLDGKPQRPDNVDYSKPLAYGPVQFGFDESFILPGSLDMYPYAFVRNNIWQGNITAQKGWSAFNRIGPAEESFEDHKVLEKFYTEAETFIRKQTSAEPFFLFLALTAPHTPTCPGVDWRGKSKLGVYGDFVMEVDHSVSRVTDALRQKGLEQNTLILFSSDHGPAPYAGNILEATPGQIKQLELKGHFANGVHRGYKFSIYEGGLRVPLIASWPALIPAGTTSDALVGLNDLYATFAELTGHALEGHEAPDSISFAHLLHNPGATPTRKNLVMQSVTAFTIRDGQWKLCLCPGSGTQSAAVVTTGNDPSPSIAWRRALDQVSGPVAESDLRRAPFVQLFDLSKDLHEDRNLAAEYPQRVEKMVQMLQQQIDEGRSTVGPKLHNDQDVDFTVANDNRLPAFVKKRIQ